MDLFDSIRRLLGAIFHSGDSESTEWMGELIAGGNSVDAVDSSEHFRKQADEFAEFWSDHDLDFSPRSLRRLDAFVDCQWEKARFQDAKFGGDDHLESMTFTGIVVQLGSYFGEVLVENHDAAWEQTDEFGWAVTVGADEEGGVLSNVFHIAQDSLREPAKFAASYDNVVAHVDKGEPISDGEHVNIAVSLPGEDAGPQEFGKRASTLIEDYPWYDLDFSTESLAAVDDLVTTEIFDGETLNDEFGEAELSKLVEKLGAYLGEVLVRTHDAEWEYADGSWAVAVELDGTTYSVGVFMAALETLHENVSFTDIYDGLVRNDEEDVSEIANEEAETLVATWPDYDLDFTPASIERLDALVVAELADTFADVGEDEIGDVLSHALSLGSYFGEVIRRNHDASWLDEDEFMIALVGGEEGVAVSAVEVAAACLGDERTFTETYEELLVEA